MSQLPGRAQDMLKQALASLAAQAPNAKPDESVIVQLAEHLAIRFALERFERGEVKVNAVRQMLDRMNQEIENLRKILGAHEDQMSEAGMLVQSHARFSTGSSGRRCRKAASAPSSYPERLGAFRPATCSPMWAD